MKKTAFITGITGQDGSYLCEFLLSQGYEVHGLLRHTSTPSVARLDQVRRRADAVDLVLHDGDLCDSTSLERALEKSQPDEVYHLAAQTDVAVSYKVPLYTADVNALGTLRLLESVISRCPDARLYNASSAEVFGNTRGLKNENSALHPCSPYGVSKVFAQQATSSYRESFGLFACSGIFFNHESERRGENFVSMKVCRSVAEIAHGKRSQLELGNLSSVRDWGYAPEYVQLMWRMLQRDEPTDYVAATGHGHTVQDLCKAAFGHVGLNWQDHVRTDERYMRPSDPSYLVGDASKAARELDWNPRVDFAKLIHRMVDNEMDLLYPSRDQRSSP